MRKVTILSIILMFALASIAYTATTWSSPKRLTFSTLTDGSPMIAIENNNLHLVYEHEQSLSTRSIYYKKKLANTTSWSTPIKIAGNLSLPWASIAAYNGKAYVVYDGNDDNIYYKTNALGSWPSTATKITSDGNDNYNPSISQENGKIYIVYVGGGGIYLRANTNGKWSAAIQIASNSFTSNTAVINSSPYVTAKGGKVHVVWSCWVYNSSTYKETDSIKYKVLSSGTWSPTQTVISSATSSSYYGFGYPHMVAYKGVPYITYELLGESQNIGFSYFNGSSWSRKNVTTNSPLSDNMEVEPDIGVYNGKIGIVWMHSTMYPDNAPSYIMYSTLKNLTSSWSSPLNLTTSSKIAWEPEIVFNSYGKANVVYTGKENGNFDIFYKKEL